MLAMNIANKGILRFHKLVNIAFILLIVAFMNVLAFGDSGGLDGIKLDTTKAKTTWTAYKFYEKTPVSGTFNDIKYTWGKADGLKGVLVGAKGVANSLSVELNDETKNLNVKDGFFKFFKTPNIAVTILEVEPDSSNVESKKDSKDKKSKKKDSKSLNAKGKILSQIELNGVSKQMWFPYTISNGVFVLNGVIDFYDFGLNTALDSLRETCEAVHEGKTWAEAAFRLEIPLK